MMRWIYAAAASLALLAAGLVHGFWTDRWAASVATTEAAALLGQVPRDLAEWKGEDLEVKPGQAGPGVTGCLQRRYTHARSGAVVVLALVNGRPGPVATHTPEVCYGASGYLVGERKPFVAGGEAGRQFWTSDAVRTKVTEETRVRLYWAWNGGEGWVASADARQAFPRSRYPVLHKLYVLRELAGPKDAPKPEDEPCVAFLQVLLPELEKVLFRRGP
jgi:hypothetical protein